MIKNRFKITIIITSTRVDNATPITSNFGIKINKDMTLNIQEIIVINNDFFSKFSANIALFNGASI